MKVEDLVDLGATMLDLFTSERGDGVLEAVDSLGDGIIDVKSADPVDNTVPSGRSAAAEAVLLLAEIGVEAATSAGSGHRVRRHPRVRSPRRIPDGCWRFGIGCSGSIGRWPGKLRAGADTRCGRPSEPCRPCGSPPSTMRCGTSRPGIRRSLCSRPRPGFRDRTVGKSTSPRGRRSCVAGPRARCQSARPPSLLGC